MFDLQTGVLPTSDRIVQDIDKAIRAFKTVHEAKGVCVPGLAGGRVAGHRSRSNKEHSKNWGGKRKKGEHIFELAEGSMHSDLESILDETKDLSTDFFRLQIEMDDDAEGGEEQ